MDKQYGLLGIITRGTTGLNTLSAAYAAAGSLHDASEAVGAASAFWAVVVILLGIIGFLIVRDRNSIQKTLDRLVVAVEALREDLLKNYATKNELTELHRRVDQIQGWATERRNRPFGEDVGI